MDLILTIGAGKTLLPADEETEEALKQLKTGTAIMVTYKKKRNLRFHRKLFALLKLILDNQRHYKTVENILEMVKFRAGYFETLVTHKGKKHYKTTSIAFENMDDMEFNKFYQSAIDVGLELCGDVDFEKEVMRFA